MLRAIRPALADGHRGAAPGGRRGARRAWGPSETGDAAAERRSRGREIWVTGTFRYANTYPTAIALAAAGRVDLKAIITGHYGLDDAEAALRAGREDPDSVKPMVVP